MPPVAPMAADPFYITTPIYYVNAAPHLGHAYVTILADVAARFHRLEGRPVYFLTGTDEHGDKIAQAAAAAGETPQAYVDRISQAFRETWAKLDITHDQFIRTTDAAHTAVVQAILRRIHTAGDIYFGEYGGWYCVGCERFYTEKEMVGGACPDHRRPLTYIKEQNYFFRMSKYQGWLLDHLERHPDFIRPERYRNEVLGFLREPLEDLCISRPTSRLTWGIPLPFDPAYVTYVWFDALINYLSALGYPDGAGFARFWPVAQHLIGKDILKPHGVYWPTMLHAAGIAPFRHLNVHGFWNVETGKMSKSVGRVVTPLELGDKYGLEALRYFVLREMIFGLDATFSEEGLVARYNAELANDLGNLVQRALTMLERYSAGRIPAGPGGDERIQALAAGAIERVRAAVGDFAFSEALAAIWEVVRACNRFVDEKAPWALARHPSRRSDLEGVLFTLAEGLRLIALLLGAFLPRTAARIAEQLGVPDLLAPGALATAGTWGRLAAGTAIRRADPLFPRILDGRETPVAASAAPAPSAGSTKPEITLEEFQRLDIRIAEVVDAEAVKGSKKLVRLGVRIGDETRTVVAGILQQYAPETLVGRRIVLLANLKPATLMGVESRGMLLAATDPTGQPVILMPDKDVPSGCPVK
jgi:methionyl-tRNA synthetase